MVRELDNLMVLGATSNAGKSLLATALCRYFSRKNLTVNPFKSQNMSLNAVVTPEGDEIGIAQKVQALAAKQCPSYLHNPILLKPQGGHVSQIVVKGQVHESLSATDYYKNKNKFSKAALESFDILAKQSDLIILEGAGSPVELNLMDRDIANLFMARAAKAKIILVVNIEMGGFFASTLGTLELMPPEDKANVIGVVVNNFRGDPSLFINDLGDFEKRIGVPILGVLPHIANLALDAEDSVSLNKFTPPSTSTKYQVRILRFPHISNFNEFQIFEHCPEISWAFTEKPEDIAEADLVILPGTKTTLEDLQWLKNKGFEIALKKHKDQGKKILGICGGFQMMGRKLEDPNHVESKNITEAEGLGFFNMTTVFNKNKILHDVTCSIIGQKENLKAFELHMGDGKPRDIPTWIRLNQRGKKSVDETGGWTDGHLYGSYLHGLFENRNMMTHFFGAGDWADMHELRESTFDQLADCIEKHLDMDLIFNQLKIKSKKDT